MMQAMSTNIDSFKAARDSLLELGVNLSGVCDKRVVEIHRIFMSGVYPVTFIEALARIDENAHRELGPESYRGTWIY